MALIQKIHMTKYDHKVCLLTFLHKAEDGDKNGTRQSGQFAPVLVFMWNNHMSILHIAALQFHIALVGNSFYAFPALLSLDQLFFCFYYPFYLIRLVLVIRMPYVIITVIVFLLII